MFVSVLEKPLNFYVNVFFLFYTLLLDLALG